MSARFEDGWVVVDYPGPAGAHVEIGVGSGADTDWRPAFLDLQGSGRVAKTRPPVVGLAGLRRVSLRVDGHVQQVGSIRLWPPTATWT